MVDILRNGATHEDPRIQIYVDTITATFKGGTSTNGYFFPNIDYRGQPTLGNVTEEYKYPWGFNTTSQLSDLWRAPVVAPAIMKCSEVYFALAEAQLKGLLPAGFNSDPNFYYQKGIDAGIEWAKWFYDLVSPQMSDLLINYLHNTNFGAVGDPWNARTLYVSVFNQGVYKSLDNGKSWINCSKGLKDNRYAWEIRQAGTKIYLLCVRGWRGEDSVDGIIYYSDDKGDNWKEATLPDGVKAPSDLLVDPVNPKRMYLSCWPKHEKNGDICGGLFVTEDGGTTWKQCFDGRVRVFAGAFDPRNTHTVFINTFQSGAYRSDDSGKTWQRILGYRFKWGHCPIPDPNDPDMLFLTTYGVSIYHGPAKGSTNEFGRIENIPDSWW